MVTTTTSSSLLLSNTNDDMNDEMIIKQMIDTMSLEDKLDMLYGSSFWTTASLPTVSDTNNNNNVIGSSPSSLLQKQQRKKSSSRRKKQKSRALSSSYATSLSSPNNEFFNDSINNQNNNQNNQNNDRSQHENTHHNDDTIIPLLSSNNQYVTLCDGPHGVRKPLIETSLQDSYLAICFPTLSCIGSSWNRNVLYNMGQALQNECILRNVQILLGPGINIKRHPCNGRNFEYITEDPYLNGILASYYVAGLQSTTTISTSITNDLLNDDTTTTNKNIIGACIKHYAVNNQETNRWIIDVIIDERTLREIYLRGFEIVIKGTSNLNNPKPQQLIEPIKPTSMTLQDNNSIIMRNPVMAHEQPSSIMCSYNLVNGVYCSEHYYLLTEILRNEWKYHGIVMSDWGACNNRSLSICAGLDLEMPGSYGACNPYLLSLLNIYDGIMTTTSTSTLDNSHSNASYLYDKVNECVIRMLKFIHKYQPSYQQHQHHSLQQQQIISEESNNDDSIKSSTNSTSKIAHGNYIKVDPLLSSQNNTLDVTSNNDNTEVNLKAHDRNISNNSTNHETANANEVSVTNDYIRNTIHSTLDFEDDDHYLANFDPSKLTLSEYEVLEKNYQTAHEIALECCVLLKNDNECLPLLSLFDIIKNNDSITETTSALPITTTNNTNTTTTHLNTTIGIIGAFGKDSPRYQGMGSSQLNPYKVTTVYDAFITRQEKYDIKNNYMTRQHKNITLLYSSGYNPNDDDLYTLDEKLLNDAITTSSQCDIVIICIGLPEIMEAEGLDRSNILLPVQHNALVIEICKERQKMLINNNNNNREQRIIVLLSNGSPIELTSWNEYPDAIMECYLLGSAGGDAIVDLLCGVVSPSGKLAESFAKSVNHIESNLYFPGVSNRRVEYREGLNIGYRQSFNNEHDIEHILYPFGHGLSYTTFEYSNIQTKIIYDEQDYIIVHVTCDIQNIGNKYTAKEIIQCYIRDIQCSIYRPYHELKDFIKIELQPFEKQTIEFTLTKDAFAFYDIGYNDWIVECGTFEIQIGSSSRDIRLIDTINLNVNNKHASAIAIESYPPIIHNQTLSNTNNNSKKSGQYFDFIDDKTFAKRFGIKSDIILNEIIEHKRIREEVSRASSKNPSFFEVIHRNTMLKEIANRRLLGHILYRATCHGALYQLEQGHMKHDNPKLYSCHKRMMMATIESLPLRALVLFSKGHLSFVLLDALIHLMNFHYISATKILTKALFSLFNRGG